MQRKKTPKGLSVAARQAVDDHYANPCPELISRHPEIAERLDVLERYWVATQETGVPAATARKLLPSLTQVFGLEVARVSAGSKSAIYEFPALLDIIES